MWRQLLGNTHIYKNVDIGNPYMYIVENGFLKVDATFRKYISLQWYVYTKQVICK